MGHIQPSSSSTWTESMATSKQISINHFGHYASGSVPGCEEHGQTGNWLLQKQVIRRIRFLCLEHIFGNYQSERVQGDKETVRWCIVCAWYTCEQNHIVNLNQLLKLMPTFVNETKSGTFLLECFNVSVLLNITYQLSCN